MSHNRRTPLLLALALLGAAVCERAAAADIATVSLGTDFAAEPCSASGVLTQGRALSIVCGKDEVAGELRVEATNALPASPAARVAVMTSRAVELVGASTDMTCSDLWAGSDEILLACTEASTSWPHIVVGSVTGGMFYCADGIPSTFPVLEKAIAHFSGRTPSAPQSALDARYSSGVLKSGTGDLKGFGHLLEAARLASGTDNFAAAENDYRAALDLEVRQFGIESMPVGETLAELALQVSNQQRFDEADDLFRRAEKIIQSSPDIAARERLTSYLALNAANQRRFQDALVLAREVASQYRAQINEASALATNGGPPVPTALRGELAHSLRIEAEMALRLDDLPTARAATDEAVWIVNEVPGLPLWWRPDVLALTAEVSEQEGHVVVAERNFHGALNLDKKLFGDTVPTALGELELGGFYGRQQVYAPAVANFRDALAILEKSPRAGSALQPDEVTPLLNAAIADPKLGADNDAFGAVQLVHITLADDVIAKIAARRAADNPTLAHLVASADTAQSKRDNLRLALASQYAKQSDAQDPRQIQTLAEALKVATADAQSQSEKLARAFPDYARLANPGPATAQEVERSLAPDEAFVTFLSGKDESFALSVTRDGLKIHQLQITRDEVVQAVAALRGAFVPRLGRLPEFSLKQSYALYQKLLAPLEPDLGHVRHLVVAPSAELASLPFALLNTAPVPAGEENAYDRARWLVRRVALSEVPSARAFLLLRQAQESRRTPSKSFIGLGDPVFSGANHDTLCSEGIVNASAMQGGFQQLPDTRREVMTIAASFGAGPDDVLLGSHANKKELQARPLDQFAVLYFATHGLLPSELRCQNEPGLVLSSASGSSDGGSILRASEISTLRLNADLVVLSACNTAASGGHRYGGGSLEGLADSFFNAGARAVLASHWSVPSKETTALMVKMFKLSANQRDYAEALRQAQLSMIADRNTAHPFNWGAFTLLGDGSGNKL